MNLYAKVRNESNTSHIDQVLDVNTVANHGNAISSLSFNTSDSSPVFGLGDHVYVELGYDNNHPVVFKGYIKQIEHNIPNDTFSFTVYDDLVRAQDYFIAASNPDAPLEKQNITAKDLVKDVLTLCGLDLSGGRYDSDVTFFTFGTTGPFEINLVNCLDYCKGIADVLGMGLWYSDNTIFFRRRDPSPMDGNTAPGNIPGDPPPYTIHNILNSSSILSLTYSITEKNLRNRVVVYGQSGVYAESSASSPYLPNGYYKTAVLAAPEMVSSNSVAKQISDFNLFLFNDLQQRLTLILVGDPTMNCRDEVYFDPSNLSSYINPSLYPDLKGRWYVYSCENQWSTTGYTTTVELTRKISVKDW